MVYQVVWTPKALESYVGNMKYLEERWTEKEVKQFISLVEKKIKLLSGQPGIGTSKNKKQLHIRHTVLHKRISLIYRVKPQKKEVELLHFWNTYQHPLKLKSK
jgi:plasmid stabilization system protein ParE